MPNQEVKRKLAAILNADVEGYTRPMSEDEVVTIRTLNAYKEAMSDLIERYRGRAEVRASFSKRMLTAFIFYPHPYQGFSSISTCKPSNSLLSPLNNSTTVINSRIASSSSPSFRTAEVCTVIQ